MKNKKGFTLVELLAVIVILGLLSAVGIGALIGTKKSANIKEAKQLESTLTELGKSIYSYEIMLNSSGDFYTKYKNEDDIKLSLETLHSAGYLKNVKISGSNVYFLSPESKDKTCDGFIHFNKSTSVIKGYVDCGNLYKTTGYDGIPGTDAIIKSTITN